MPIYEYICQDCTQRFDRFWPSVAAADGKLPICPACESIATRRVVSQVAVLGESGGLTPQEQSAAGAQTEKRASITSQEQIRTLQANRQKRREQGR